MCRGAAELSPRTWPLRGLAACSTTILVPPDGGGGGPIGCRPPDPELAGAGGGAILVPVKVSQT
jgi:hypothetical protein